MKVSRTVVVLLVVLGLLSAWLNAPAIISRVAYAVGREHCRRSRRSGRDEPAGHDFSPYSRGRSSGATGCG